MPRTSAKQQGKIRFAGVSTHSGQKDLFPAAIAKKHFDVILTSYNFTMDPAMDGLIQSAKEAGIGSRRHEGDGRRLSAD